VGAPIPDVQIRIVDDSGRDLPRDEVGNIQVRGPNVFIGYWQLPDKTAEDFTDDGFFNTGDKGKTSDDGYTSIIGRAKDVVITGGLNVYPKEVELFIDDLGGVKESAIIGVPHADFGEAVVAVVVRDSDSTIDAPCIIQSAKESLANFKIPKHVVFLDELPRNSMAKVQKNILREKYNDLFESAT
jgi:malonyl-CoA/methylmalonyl-CoA synthetase